MENKENFAIDSVRSLDSNGYLHIAESPLTKETVNPYYGREIPDWETSGLDPEKIYNGYRSGSELKKALKTFNGIPLLITHKLDSASEPLKEERIGSVGTNALWKPPYIFNAITVTDKAAIELIESGNQKELSACYRYKPEFVKGTFEGVSYDFIMTDIEANHVAIVDEGRAGADVYVYDSSLVGVQFRPSVTDNNIDNNTISKENDMPKKVEELRQAAKVFMDAFNGFLDEEGAEQEHASDEADVKKAMDKAGCDAEDPAQQKAFAEGVKHGETVQKTEPKKANGEHAKDEDGAKKAMDKAGCDADDPAQQKAFAEGVKYGESKEKTEPKKLDGEHEAEGTKKQITGDNKDISAKDSKLAFDKAIAGAEERGAAKAVAKLKSLYEAAESVRGTVIVKPLAYDSASDIYAAALGQEGVSIASVDRGAYRSLYLAVVKNKRQSDKPNYAADSGQMEDTPFSKNVKVEE